MTRLLRLTPALLLALAGCDDDSGPRPSDGGPRDMAAAADAGTGPDGAGPDGAMMAKDPATAPKMPVDRFSDAAGMLMRRSAAPTLPSADQPIDFDKAPFITGGLGPRGEKVRYYNFDVQPTAPAPIYVLFRAGDSKPLPGQLNIVDVVPGDAGYNDFWQVHKVTVPAGYVANTVTSRAELLAAGYQVEATQMLVNCPVVPNGSKAALRIGGGSAALVTGWYKGKTIKYFSFEERELMGAAVPTSPIYVTFNTNPNQPGGGPGSGFRTESGPEQTHNVIATVPSDAAYSPLWLVNVYDNAAFASVADLATAMAAPQLGAGVAKVNCPVVEVLPAGAAKDPAAAPKMPIDRFSDQAAMLMRRSAAPMLPGPDQPIDFDQGPFVTQGLGPRGEKVKYYNFDVQPSAPAPIYVLFRAGESMPLGGQLNVVDVVPGDQGYSDFWQVHKVTVAASYVANTVTSRAEIQAAGFPVEATQMLVNCPVVPDGSKAPLRIGAGPAGLTTGWYKGKIIKYFSFEEKASSGAAVPTSAIYVAFNVNPDQPGGGPGSGFKAEPGTSQTHNVVATVPSDAGYSPLWSVNVYDNAAFATVANLATAMAAPQLGTGVAKVNCPVVEVK